MHRHHRGAAQEAAHLDPVPHGLAGGDPVSITLDCQVQGDYTVTLLSGEKGDENSFEEPEKVKMCIRDSS